MGLARGGAGLAIVALAGAALIVAGCGGGETTTVTVTGDTSAAAPPATAPATAPATTPTDTVATVLEPPKTESVATTPAPAPAPAPPAPPPLVDRPAGFPNGAEAFLLARLPAEVADRCTREDRDDRSRGSIAGLDCDTRTALGAKAWYELFPSRAFAEAAYARYREANDVPVRAGRGCVNARGAATGSLPGEATWAYGAAAADEGRLMCFREGDGDVWYISYGRNLREMTFVTAKSRAAAARYWGQVGYLRPKPVAR